MHPKVDEFMRKAKQWQEEMEKLRMILLDCPLTEEFKWWQPVYTFQDNNVAIVSGFKDYCVLSFFKGALLKDEHTVLCKPGANSRAVRMFKFTSVSEIVKMEPILKSYIYEAIELERAGLKINFKEDKELNLPEEFKTRLKEDPALKAAFEALTPGRQRAYNLYFSAPKQSKTREARIEKCTPQILAGKGIKD
ncbi:MAG: YdeI/OmpD-associated family protein [Ignavibacteriales bacterium]|nr:YdeI/OmpD-associated family protein [Ignavibacteriales bacterium]